MSREKSPSTSTLGNGTEANGRPFCPPNGSARSGTDTNGCPSSRLNGSARSVGLNGPSPYSFDVQKYLKDVLRRREDVPAARVLPKTHLLQQLLLQEQSARELFLLQERALRQQLVHKREEDRAKREEQRLQQRSRERLEELKRRQSEELAARKEAAAAFQKHIDAEVRERLRLVCLLQPRLAVAAAALAEVRREGAACRLLPELLEEERRVAKALRADPAHALRTAVAGSFNVGAILRGAALRAGVEDAVKVPNAALRKLLVVRAVGGEAAAWAHVRGGGDTMAIAAELAQLPAPELPRGASAGVVWPKEDVADLTRRAKAAAEADILAVVGVSAAQLSCHGIHSHEFTRKEIEAIGQLASA